MSDGGAISVTDTSSLVEAKLALPVGDQWGVFKHLEELVVAGSIAVPRHVIKETSEIAHPDVPGAWASGVRNQIVHPLEPEWEHVETVMKVASDVVDPNKTEEDADPYVLALALQLQEQGRTVQVVTEDHVDHLPIRIAMTTACERLGLAYCDVRSYLNDLGHPTIAKKL